MDAKGVRNMYSMLVVVIKHNTTRVASCWFIIYYRLLMHGKSNMKKVTGLFPPGVELAGPGSHHPPPSSTDVKERVEPSWQVIWRTLPI